MGYAIDEFMMWNGIEQEEVINHIKDEKRKFVFERKNTKDRR